MNHDFPSTAALAAAWAAAAWVAVAPASAQSPAQPGGQAPGEASSQATPVPMPSPATSASMVTQAGRSFVQQAAATGMAEVAAARLALQRSRDEQVRRYAQRMLDDHEPNNAVLRRLAAQHRIDLPQEPGSQDAAMLRDLRATQGEDAFDQRYVSHFGVAAHQKATDLFEHHARNLAEPSLRDYAGRTLPTLREHLAMARRMDAAWQARAPAAGGARGTPGAVAGMSAADRELSDARDTVTEAVQMVQQLKADPRTAALLPRAKAVLLLPDYGRGGLVIGAQGGQGVLVARQGDGWSDPVFYNLGGVSVGAQAGAAAGRIALLLMTERALERVRSDRRFSLTADAGLTVADLSRRRQASGGKLSDVVLWSDTQGAYAGASVGLSGLIIDRDANEAYYRRPGVQVAQILDGRVQNPNHNLLEMVLSV